MNTDHMTNKEYRAWKAEQRTRIKDMSLEELTEFTQEVERVRRVEAEKPHARFKRAVTMVFVYVAAAIIILGGAAYKIFE